MRVNIPGAERHHLADYEEDGEYGAGRKILSEMIENDVKNRVIFIARFCGKQKLGGTRLSSYMEAARKAVEKNLYNEIVKETQSFDNNVFREQREEERRRKYEERKAKGRERKERKENPRGDNEPHPNKTIHSYVPRTFISEGKRRGAE